MASVGASEVQQPPSQPRGGGNRRGGERNRGRGRGRGKGDQGGRGAPGGPRVGRGGDAEAQQIPQPNGQIDLRIAPTAPGVTTTTEDVDDGASDASVIGCDICAYPIQYYAIAPCNHITCHVCSLRRRVLYKTKACAHCRTESDFVIFTENLQEGMRYEDFKDEDIAVTNDRLGVKYTDRKISDDTILLRRYNCPEETCDEACRGWPSLHKHVRDAHKRVMCDLCTRHKKAFTHEHSLFTEAELRSHERHGDDQPGATNQSGFKGHPECKFCRQRFYSTDELFEHCRDKHERCYICDRLTQGVPNYFANYDTLEDHFRKDHFLCPDTECLEKKFVVFENEIDLQAHQLEEHPNGPHRAKRDARRIDMGNFDTRPFQQSRGGGGRWRGSRGHQDTDDTPAGAGQQMDRAQTALHRQLAIQSSQSTTSRTFGGALSDPLRAAVPAAPAARPSTQSAEAPPTRPPAPPPRAAEEVFPALGSGTRTPTLSEPARPVSRPKFTNEVRRLKDAALVERASILLRNDPKKLDLFRTNVSKFCKGQVSGSDLVDIFWEFFSVSAVDMGKLLNELIDLYEDENKQAELRKAWNNWKAINEDYPPIAGATYSTAPVAASTGRVLKLKSSTAGSSRSKMARQMAWGAAATAPSSAPTPPLPSSNPNRLGKGRVTITPWVAPSNVPSRSNTPAAAVKKDDFPSLPPKKMPAGWTPVPSRRTGWESPAPAVNAWSGEGAGGDQELEAPEEEGTKGSKKKKGKQKQLLFHVGL